ncbi:MAG: MBL fold metallo-hydrolase [Leptospiraceae bacterium]|nr:MBL fold metallo-hydrolase [Leptospiraceae bacterium]
MEIKLYGVRGSCPTPVSPESYSLAVSRVLEKAFSDWKTDPEKFSVKDFLANCHISDSSLIGGNTTCAYVTSSSGDKLILDCGTGIRVLGNDLLKGGITEDKKKLNILITHTHWDHIQGWPFFKLGYVPGVSINFYSTIPNLKERLERQQHPENFPLPFDLMPSTKSFYLQEMNTPFQIGDFEITPFALKHPGACTGYKIKENDKVFLFCTDVEIAENDFTYMEKLRPIAQDADLMIRDAQYNTEEARAKAGWGHTSGYMVVKSALSFGVKTIALTHHEPDHTDATIYSLMDEAVKQFHTDSKLPNVVLATEGMTFKL